MIALFRNIFAPPRDLILVVAAAWLGLTLAEKRARHYGFSLQTLNNLVFASLLAYIMGGRLFYVMEHFNAFAQSPLSLISINITLFDVWGALAAALITAFVYAQRNGLSGLSTLGALTPFFATIAVGLGFSHLASGAVFGQETSLPWGIELWGATRHPTQIYEIIAALLTLILLWSRKAGSQPGSDFLLFTALTSASQLLIAGFRGDTTLVFGGLRAEQIIAWIALAVSLAGMEFLRPKEVEAMKATDGVAPAKLPKAAARKSAAAQKVKAGKAKKKTYHKN